MRETHKYLGSGFLLLAFQNSDSDQTYLTNTLSKAKVNESKMRKNKSKDASKKDMPTGPGGLRKKSSTVKKSDFLVLSQMIKQRTFLNSYGGLF